MSEQLINEILKKATYEKWEDRQVFANVSEEKLDSITRDLKKRFRTHLTSIAARKSDEKLELIYHFIVNDVPLILAVNVSRIASFQSIKHIIPSAGVYEDEIRNAFCTGR
jgi:Ni,Fe-hydrogenase III component G